MSEYDSIIIGAGHNGLVCAAYLGRAGQKVLVLEAAATPGGLAATREFHPGFRAAVAHSVNHFSGKIAADLGLERHGFRSQAHALTGLDGGRRHVTLRDGELTGAGADDAAAYAEYARLLQRFADALSPFWLKTMPRIGSSSVGDLSTFAQLGLRLLRLGRADMREFLRITSLPVRDLVDEYFDSALAKALLSWDGLIGARMAPRSPNSAVLALLYRMSGIGGSVGPLAGALLRAAQEAGAEIRCGAEVERIVVRAGTRDLAATGVMLADGTEIDARNVISATDPRRTFIDLLGVEYLDIGFTNRIRRLRCDGYVAKLHLALDGLPEFDGLASPDGRLVIAPDMDAIEFAYDDAKYGECPQQPVMEITVPSVTDPSLAPAGQHVLSAQVMYVPYALKGGWTDAARDAIRERAIDTIAAYAPDIRRHILRGELLTPFDLEQRYRVTGGHWHHAEFAMDQLLMMRPTYEAAQYATPVPGLYLCGAGSHPGGDLVGAAGHNAAREVLR